MLRGAKQEAALCWALGGASLSAAVENGTGWSCWWVHSCLGVGMRGPGDVPALAVVCKVLVTRPSPVADQAANISLRSLKLAALPHSVSAGAWQEPCWMFQPQPVHTQMWNAQHCNGLEVLTAVHRAGRP